MKIHINDPNASLESIGEALETALGTIRAVQEYPAVDQIRETDMDDLFASLEVEDVLNQIEIMGR